MQALAHLQGLMLKSSDRGGLRVEFAKANMGEVRSKIEFPLKLNSTVTIIPGHIRSLPE